jgi:hypothetical protein
MKDYRRSIEMRCKLFDAVKDITLDERLDVIIDKMYINQAGCYLMISKSCILEQDEYNKCVEYLENIIKKYSGKHSDYADILKNASEKLEAFRKLKPKSLWDR